MVSVEKPMDSSSVDIFKATDAGVDLTPPMVNRLCVIPWETPVEAIRQGWRNGLEFPAPEIPLLEDQPTDEILFLQFQD